MKFLLLLNKDIYCANCIKLLSPEMEKHEVKIILSQKVGDISDLPLELVEMKGFEEDLDKNDGVFDKYPTVFSEDLEIPQNVNSDEILQKIKKFTPDLIISIRFGQILQQKLIDIPKYGVLNLHSGILPKYRGILASFWAIFCLEKEIGTTLHYIDNKEIDRGNIIKISKRDVNFKTSLSDNIYNLYEQGCHDIIDAINRIKDGNTIESTSQDNILKTDSYFSYPTNHEIKEFLEKMDLF